ncbi:MAG: hypothetical protein OJF55_001299 [Rhodanobacteraceae bacterium]|jgi:hypothetical protein|nr:MAG: hypothetical protein OJF55_001299 [Rhodanobacteraceae bacterium]
MYVKLRDERIDKECATQTQLGNTLVQQILAGEFVGSDIIKVDAEHGKLAFHKR